MEKSMNQQENAVSRYSQCSRYAIDWQQLLNTTDVDLFDLQPNASWPTEYCFNGWNYNKTLVTSSIVIDVIFKLTVLFGLQNVNSNCILFFCRRNSLIWCVIETFIRQ